MTVSVQYHDVENTILQPSSQVYYLFFGANMLTLRLSHNLSVKPLKKILSIAQVWVTEFRYSELGKNHASEYVLLKYKGSNHSFDASRTASIIYCISHLQISSLKVRQQPWSQTKALNYLFEQNNLIISKMMILQFLLVVEISFHNLKFVKLQLQVKNYWSW